MVTYQVMGLAFNRSSILKAEVQEDITGHNRSGCFVSSSRASALLRTIKKVMHISYQIEHSRCLLESVFPSNILP
jgi:hypothetical protein